MEGNREQTSKMRPFLGDRGERMKQETGTESGVGGQHTAVGCRGVILAEVVKKMEVRR